VTTAKDAADQRSFAEHPRHGRSYGSTWGSLEVSDPTSARRSGMTRYRLEIFPPGTNYAERRQLIRFRQWRLWGAFAALTGAFLVGSIGSGWQVPLYIAATYIAGLMLGLQMTQRLRKAIHTVSAATIRVGGSPYVEGDLNLLENCVNEFERLDRERAENRVDPVEYESVWTNLYARLETRRSGASQ